MAEQQGQASWRSQLFKRRIVYIHKPFQRSFILKFCAIALAAMLFASLFLYSLSKDTMTATYRYHHLSLHDTADAILPALIITNSLVLLVFIVATIFLTLYVSHKIGGPLYRFGKSLESIGEGNLNLHIKLRPHDQLKDFADQMNQMTDNLGKKISRIREEVTELKNKTKATGVADEEIVKGIESLEQTVYGLFQID